MTKIIVWDDLEPVVPYDAPEQAPEAVVLTPFTATMIAEGDWDAAGVEPSEETFIQAVQYLIDTGLVWQLQGYFGRLARTMIEEGHCTPKR